MALGLHLFSIEPVKDLLLMPLEDALPALARESVFPGEGGPEAVVVLGGGLVQSSPEAEGGRDTLSASTLKRVLSAKSLADRFSLPIVFAGGKVFDYGQEDEADVASRVLAALGLPPRRFFAEKESRNTWENARNAASLFGYRKVILVTSAWHMRRSVSAFEENGVSVIPAPTDYLCDRNSPYDILSFLPSLGALSGTYTALHEYMGLLYYRLVYP
jgi:uncharacterized SAM-binding protein YcdF (DUF218 family)